jgi:copper homeostasis protein
VNKSKLNIELCCFSASGLCNLDESIRIELCSNYLEGGLSPTANLFLHIRSIFNNKIVTMVRPRGGDFCYSDSEFQMMKSEILWFKENGADGIVLGLLNPDGSIDKERTSILVEIARPLPVTFHRAFDMSVDYYKSLEDIIDTGCSRILSSGGAKNVDLGFDNLVQLLKLAVNRVELIPGSGVNIYNVKKFIDVGFKNIHLSSKMDIKSKMEYRANLSMSASPNISSFDYIGVDLQKLNQFIAYVRKNENL